jgi:putative DNA primase/helicase
LTPGRDELKKEEWDGINQWLLRLRSRGVAVVLIHHAGKDEKRGPRGTSGMGDSLDSIIFLSKPKDYVNTNGARFKVEFTKNPRQLADRANITPFEFWIKPDGEGVVLTTSKVKSERKDLAIFLLLEGKLKRQEILEKTGYKDDSRISQIIGDITQKELAIKKGKELIPTGKGKKWLENYNLLTTGYDEF